MISGTENCTRLKKPLTKSSAVYVIKFTENGLEDVKALPKNVRNSMKKQLPLRLSQDPLRHSLPLNPPLEKFRSCHVGEYRVLFHVAEDIHAIAIAGVGKHSANPDLDVYRKLEKLVRQGTLAERLLAALRGF